MLKGQELHNKHKSWNSRQASMLSRLTRASGSSEEGTLWPGRSRGAPGRNKTWGLLKVPPAQATSRLKLFKRTHRYKEGSLGRNVNLSSLSILEIHVSKYLTFKSQPLLSVASNVYLPGLIEKLQVKYLVACGHFRGAWKCTTSCRGAAVRASGHSAAYADRAPRFVSPLSLTLSCHLARLHLPSYPDFLDWLPASFSLSLSSFGPMGLHLRDCPPLHGFLPFAR